MGGLSFRRWPRAYSTVLLPAADFSHSSCWFITARLIHSRVGQSDELSSIRASASYCGGVSPLRMTMSMPFGSTGRSTCSILVPPPFDPHKAVISVGVLPAPSFNTYKSMVRLRCSLSPLAQECCTILAHASLADSSAFTISNATPLHEVTNET